MKCVNCNEDVSSKDCSAREGLLFFGICKSCSVVNKFEIDLNSNKIVSSYCLDEEVEFAESLFVKKVEMAVLKSNGR